MEKKDEEWRLDRKGWRRKMKNGGWIERDGGERMERMKNKVGRVQKGMKVMESGWLPMKEKESRRKKREWRLKGKDWIIKILEKIETWSKQSLRTLVKTSKREKRGKYCNHFLSKLIFNLRTETWFTLCTCAYISID